MGIRGRVLRMPGESPRGAGFGLEWRTWRVPSPESAAHVCCLRHSRVVRGAQPQAANDNSTSVYECLRHSLTHCATRARHTLSRDSRASRGELLDSFSTFSRPEYLNHALRRTGGGFPRDVCRISHTKTRKLRAAFRWRLEQNSTKAREGIARDSNRPRRPAQTLAHPAGPSDTLDQDDHISSCAQGAQPAQWRQSSND